MRVHLVPRLCRAGQALGGRLQRSISLRAVTAAIAFLACTLEPSPTYARTWNVPEDAPTIQAGIDSSGVGDDVLVAEGQYSEHNIVLKAGIRVQSDLGPASTIIDGTRHGRVLDCVDLQEGSIIEGFTIINGLVEGLEEHDGGGGVRCLNSELLMRDCVIVDCAASVHGGGIFAWESSLEIESCEVRACEADGFGGGIAAWFVTEVRIADCKILNNEASSNGGILALGPNVSIRRSVVSENVATWGNVGGIGCHSPQFVIEDCLLVGNSEEWVGGPSGLYVGDGSIGVISGCTVADNRGWNSEDPAIYLSGSDVALTRTIVAFNTGIGLRCVYSQIATRCCDVFGNSEGDDICGTDLGGNLSADPLFCDPEGGDYTLNASSPCLPGNHPDGEDCGLIGALGEGCGAIPVKQETWGRIRAGYR